MTEARSIKKRPPIGFLAALIVISAACLIWYLAVAHEKPATDDATIDAEVIHVASEVGGRITVLNVQENSAVRRGDVLFRIDPTRYAASVEAARAQVDVALAALKTGRRTVQVEKWNAAAATTQIGRAETNLDLSVRTEDRLRPLSEKGYVPKQQLDQASSARRDAATSVTQAKEQQQAAHHAIGDTDAELATLHAAKAALMIAEKALHDTTVRAAHNGIVVGLTVSTGELIAPSQSLFTMVNTEEWYAVANLREIDLQQVGIGQCATAYSMVDRHRAMKGTIQGIGSGIQDEDKVDLPRSLPYVQSSLNWVRVAHRFPVRVHLIDPPPELVRLGASALVEVGHGTACNN